MLNCPIIRAAKCLTDLGDLPAHGEMGGSGADSRFKACCREWRAVVRRISEGAKVGILNRC